MIFSPEEENRRDVEARTRDGYTHKVRWRDNAWYFRSEAEARAQADGCGNDAVISELPGKPKTSPKLYDTEALSGPHPFWIKL